MSEGERGNCRSRQELSNAYLVAKIGVDTAESEPSKLSSLIPTQAIKLCGTPVFRAAVLAGATRRAARLGP